MKTAHKPYRPINLYVNVGMWKGNWFQPNPYVTTTEEELIASGQLPDDMYIRGGSPTGGFIKSCILKNNSTLMFEGSGNANMTMDASWYIEPVHKIPPGTYNLASELGGLTNPLNGYDKTCELTLIIPTFTFYKAINQYSPESAWRSEHYRSMTVDLHFGRMEALNFRGGREYVWYPWDMLWDTR
jgi:hypothetical protein